MHYRVKNEKIYVWSNVDFLCGFYFGGSRRFLQYFSLFNYFIGDI